MRQLIWLVRQTLLPSLLVALLSGAIAWPGLMIGMAVWLGGGWLLHPEVPWHNSIAGMSLPSLPRSLLTAPFWGMAGSLLLWRITLPFGLVSVLIQHVAGPSRKLSVGFAALCGAATTLSFGHFDLISGMPIVPSEPMGATPGTPIEHVEILACCSAIGALVGLLIPWRYLLRSWATRARAKRNAGLATAGSRTAG